jgi:hypothetical protein
MALVIFAVFGVLGCIFLIFVLLKWTYGEKTRRHSRRLATRAKRDNGQSPNFFLVLRKKHAAHLPAARRKIQSAPNLNGMKLSRSASGARDKICPPRPAH